MKKVVLTVLVVTAVAVTVGKLSDQRRPTNNLLLENIEALAEGETEETRCWGIGSIYCPQTRQCVAYVLVNHNLY